VIASRDLPPAPWREDPGWRQLARVVALRNLDPFESAQLLADNGVPHADRARIVEVSHGHPLALALMADVATRGGRLDADPLGPERLRTRLARFFDSVPDGSRRRVLGAAALARVTTESLLRDVVDEDAEDAFTWLRDLSVVAAVEDGLALHDLARDVLEADL